MLFNSWEFVLLLILTFVLYYVFPSRNKFAKSFQVSLLLVASAVFYGWENYRLLYLLAISCVGNSIAAGYIIKHKISNNERNVVIAVRYAIILNLALLFVFKYLSFIFNNIPWLTQDIVNWAKDIPLPIGISFYTFHGISMIVDISRGEVSSEGKNLINYENDSNPIKKFLTGIRDIGFYLLFFPQLVAGPIVKAKQFWPQIGSKKICDINWEKVIKSLILGFFLKMVVADNLAEQTVHLTTANIVFMSSLDLLFLLYGYSFQIFADFAGYSLIAIGLAAMFGYEFPINFNFPYIATSITEFWRRWHMSLSSWLREYLYIPLGGNRRGELRTYLNLFLVMFLGGMWHGADWKFAIWGTAHGLFLALERLFTHYYKIRAAASYLKFFGWMYTFNMVCLLWLTFLMPGTEQIVLFFKQLMIGNKSHGPYIFVPVFFGIFVVLYHIVGFIGELRNDWFTKYKNTWREGMVYGFLLFMIITNSGAPQGFIYFQF